MPTAKAIDGRAPVTVVGQGRCKKQCFGLMCNVDARYSNKSLSESDYYNGNDAFRKGFEDQALNILKPYTRFHILLKFDSEWSNLAIGVLSKCNSTCEKKTHNLLVRELTNWGHSTCMLIAVKSDNKDFISQPACQSLLNRVWMGEMSQENSTLKVTVQSLWGFYEHNSY